MIGTPTLVFPINPERAEVGWRGNAVRFRSPWDTSEQRIRRFGQWVLRYEWSLLSRLEYGVLMGLFNRNSDDRFTTYDIAREHPALVDSGTFVSTQFDNLRVNGANQTGRTLVCDGAPLSQLCFKAGDLIGMEFSGEVYELAADASSGGSGPPVGPITFQLNQYIRTPPQDNERVITSRVPIRVWLAGPVVATVSEGPPRWALTAEMYEALT